MRGLDVVLNAKFANLRAICDRGALGVHCCASWYGFGVGAVVENLLDQFNFMKRFYSPLLLLLIMFLGSCLPAQIKEDVRPAVRFGINGGGAWQCSDVRTTGGGGFGATLEVPIVENDHSWLGIGLRARYLWTRRPMAKT